MSDVVLSTTESVTSVTTVDDVVSVAVTNNVVEVSASTAGVQGASYAQGDPIYVKVTNKTGSLMPKGTIVYTSGAVGNHVTVAPALADSDVTSSRALGWLSTALANNADGFAVIEGYLSGIDTDHIPEGSQLYLSPTVPGGFTATKPVAPDHMVYVGVLGKSNPGNGQVFVKIQNGYELDELHDVQIISPTDNQILTYEASTSLWKNAANPADGVTSITATSPLTGGTITSSGSIGLDQTLLTLAQSQITNLVTDLAGKANLAGGNAFTGSQTIATGAAEIIGLQVNAFTGQTADLAQFRDASSTLVTKINSAGLLSTTRNITINGSNAGEIAMIVRGASGQTARLTEWRNSGGTILAGVTNGGAIATTNYFQNVAGNTPYIDFTTANRMIVQTRDASYVGLILKGAASQTANLQEWQDNAAGLLARITSSGIIETNQYVNMATSANAGIAVAGLYRLAFGNTNISTQANASGSGSVGLVVRGASGQTADLLQLQNSSGTILWKTDQNGFTTVGTNTVLSNALLSIAPYGVTQVGAVIRGASGQTADLQQWQNSAGTVLASFSNTGTLNVNTTGTGILNLGDGQISKGPGSGFSFTSGLNNIASLGVGTTALNSEPFRVYFGAATYKTVIRGAASQTANLQEWQNSAGTVLTRITASGEIVVPSNAIRGNELFTFNYYGRLQEASSGARLSLVKMTAAAVNPGAGIGSMYFRDGTNAGTLKLVVRAGAAGAETTILDNIPQ